MFTFFLLQIERAICEFAKDSKRNIISTCKAGDPPKPKTETNSEQTCCERACVSPFVLACWTSTPGPSHIYVPKSVDSKHLISLSD